MSEVTYFVVQPFVRHPELREVIVPGEPVQAPSESAARRAVATLPNGMVGAIAFSRTGDPQDGEWGEAVVLSKNGQIPATSDVDDLPW